VLELLLVAREQAFELLLRFLEPDRLEQLRDDEQQDDRAEAARHGVEKRQAQRLDLAVLSLSHRSVLTASPRRAPASSRRCSAQATRRTAPPSGRLPSRAGSR